jgi:hypothetical protein
MMTWPNGRRPAGGHGVQPTILFSGSPRGTTRANRRFRCPATTGLRRHIQVAQEDCFDSNLLPTDEIDLKRPVPMTNSPNTSSTPARKLSIPVASVWSRFRWWTRVYCMRGLFCATHPAAVRVVAAPALPNEATTPMFLDAATFYLLPNEALASVLAETIPARTSGALAIVRARGGITVACYACGGDAGGP